MSNKTVKDNTTTTGKSIIIWDLISYYTQKGNRHYRKNQI